MRGRRGCSREAGPARCPRGLGRMAGVGSEVRSGAQTLGIRVLQPFEENPSRREAHAPSCSSLLPGHHTGDRGFSREESAHHHSLLIQVFSRNPRNHSPPLAASRHTMARTRTEHGTPSFREQRQPRTTRRSGSHFSVLPSTFRGAGLGQTPLPPASDATGTVLRHTAPSTRPLCCRRGRQANGGRGMFLFKVLFHDAPPNITLNPL